MELEKDGGDLGNFEDETINVLYDKKEECPTPKPAQIWTSEEWEPYRYFYEDGVCFVFAKPGTLSRGDLECSMVTDGTEVERWVLQPTEIQISPLLEITRDAGQAQIPIRIYLPSSRCYSETRRPVIKVQMCREETWSYHDPKLCSVHQEDDEVYTGVEIKLLTSIKIMIVGEPIYQSVILPPEGLVLPEHLGRIHLTDTNDHTCLHLSTPIIPYCDIQDARTGAEPDILLVWAMVILEIRSDRPLSSPVEVEINAYQHNKIGNEIESFQSALLRSCEFIARNIIVSKELLDRLVARGVVTCEEAAVLKCYSTEGGQIQAFVELLNKRANLKYPVLRCLRESGNRAVANEIEEKIRQEQRTTGIKTYVVGTMGNTDSVILAPPRDSPGVVVAAVQSGVQSLILPPDGTHYSVVGLAMSGHATEEDIRWAAKDVYNMSYGRRMTLLIAQNKRNPVDIYLACVPSEMAVKEQQTMSEKGYTDGLNAMVEFPMNMSDQLEISFSGNVGMDCGSFKIHKDKFRFIYDHSSDRVELGGYLFVADAAIQNLEKAYSGRITYGLKVRRGDASHMLRCSGFWNVYLPKDKDVSPAVCLSPHAEVKALCVFIAVRVSRDLLDTDSLYYMLDTVTNVHTISRRVSTLLARYPNINSCQMFLHIWAHAQPMDKKRKIQKLLRAIEQFGFVDEAKAFINLYTSGGLVSDASVLRMANLIGREWREVADKLGVPSTDLDNSLDKGSELSAKARMLDMYRFSDGAVMHGLLLPHELKAAMGECRASRRLFKYI